MPSRPNMMEYFIIEHPTRGTLREYSMETPHFTVSGHRGDDNSQRYRTLKAALDTITQITVRYPRIGPKLVVRRSSDWKAYCVTCRKYADKWFEHEDRCEVYQAEVRRHG
jgi:hypothetical protein